MNEKQENYNIDNELYKIYYYLKYFNQDIKYLSNNTSIDLTKINNDVKKIFDEYFKIKDIIYYPHNLSKINFIKNNQISNGITMNPFNIPITFNNKKDSVRIRNIYMNNNKYTIVQNLYLKRNNTIRETYAHEITHTQVSYSLEDDFYLEDELFPIFMERFTGNKFNNNNVIYNRLYYLYQNLSTIFSNKYSDDELDIYLKIEASKYIESTLKAYYLYFIYINEPLSSTRANLIDNINEVFKDNLNIKHLLNKYDVNNNYKNLTLFKQSIKH